MRSARAAWCIRRLARLDPDARKYLHREARGLHRRPAGWRVFAWGALLSAVIDLRQALGWLVAVWKRPDLFRVRDAWPDARSALVWLLVAGVCALTRE